MSLLLSVNRERVSVVKDKKKKEFSAWTARSVARSLIPFCRTLSRRVLNPIKLAYDRRRPDGRPITASAFNQLGQYASNPGNRAYCYSELAVSSLAVAETIASTHCAYNGGMARLSRPG